MSQVSAPGMVGRAHGDSSLEWVRSGCDQLERYAQQWRHLSRRNILHRGEEFQHTTDTDLISALEDVLYFIDDASPIPPTTQ